MTKSHSAHLIPGTLVWSVAGPDTGLAAALQELAAGGFIAAADLLRAASPALDLRCYRLLLMAQTAAASGAAERWIAEEPNNRDAVALHARVAVIRALRAHRERHPRAVELEHLARRVCIAAAERSPWDPVPWVARLQLASIPPPEGWQYSDDVYVEDPYRLIGEVQHRHEYSREGHHRLLAAVSPDAGGSVIAMFDHARAIARQAPAGSPLHLLPLLVHLKSFQRKAGSNYRDQVVFADQEWSTAQARHEIAGAYDNWFTSRLRGAEPALLPDLHLLAHGLWKASMFAEAGQVFTEIGQWALPLPWSAHGDASIIVLRARNRCLQNGPPA